MPRSPRDSSKNAVLVPPKLSSELELRSTFLGQFFQVLGLHLSQDPSEKGGVLAQDSIPTNLLLGIKIPFRNSIYSSHDERES